MEPPNKPSITFMLEVLIESYYQDTGKKPAAIILGPAEYRELCYQTKHSDRYLKQAAVEEVLITDYKGFPIYVKEMPGIDLVIGYQEAFGAAYR